MTSPHDYRRLTERMRELTADTQRIRAEYERAEVTGVSPDGSVRVTMRAGRLVSLVIDPAAMDQDNLYVAEQVSGAIRQAEDRFAESLRAQTSPMIAAVEELRNRFQ